MKNDQINCPDTYPDENIGTLSQKITVLEKRLQGVEENIKTTISFTSIAISVVGVVFIGFTIYSGYNINRTYKVSKEIMADTEKKVANAVSKVDLALINLKKSPELKCYKVGTLEELNDSTIQPQKDNKQIRFNFSLHNISSVESGHIYFKCYTKDPLMISNIKGTSDETLYDYENSAPAGTDRIGDSKSGYFRMPPDYSSIMEWGFDYKGKGEIPRGVHPVLLKIYYGKDMPLRIKFNILID